MRSNAICQADADLARARRLLHDHRTRTKRDLLAAGVLRIDQPSDNANRKATVCRYRGPSILTITSSMEEA
jgi:hypothetical protein